MTEEPPLKSSRPSDTVLDNDNILSLSSPQPSDTTLTSPKSIRLQDSLLLSITSQWLKLSAKSCSGLGTFQYHNLKTELQTFIQRVGFISNRFCKLAFSAVILFFKNITFRLDFGTVNFIPNA
ncbi:hypothetical protein GEMRC1_006905 [Eukaryota sp. GEM-RC1]